MIVQIFLILIAILHVNVDFVQSVTLTCARKRAQVSMEIFLKYISAQNVGTANKEEKMGYEVLCKYVVGNPIFNNIENWKVNFVFDNWPEADAFAQALIYRWSCFGKDTRKTIFAGEKEIQVPWIKEDGSVNYDFRFISAQIIYEELPIHYVS